MRWMYKCKIGKEDKIHSPMKSKENCTNDPTKKKKLQQENANDYNSMYLCDVLVVRRCSALALNTLGFRFFGTILFFFLMITKVFRGHFVLPEISL